MGPAVFLIPLGVIALLAGAAQAKKKPANTAAGYQPPAAKTAQVPADVQAMIAAAVNSGNPETQRRVANTIRPQYPAQATYLETVASELEPILAQWGASTLAEAQQKEAQAAAVQAAQQAAAQQAAQGAPPIQQVAAAQTAAAQTIQQASAAQASQPPLVTSAATSTPGFVPPLPTVAATSAVPSATPTQPPLPQPTAADVAQAMAAPVQALQAAQSAGTAALAAGASIPQAILAAQNAATMATSPAVNVAVQSAAAATMPQPPMATPVTSSTPASTAGKQLAADLAKALKAGKKGTSSEPKAMVQAFQKQENLAKQDGSYGYETAIALADRYAIVPPKPMYWGEKGGAYNLVASQKQAYSAHLLALASQDPQRADEWKAAAKV